MSKVLEATCVGGLVTSHGTPVVEADILSQGIGLSSGVLILDDDEATYVTSNASDLKDAISKIASTLDTIGTTLTSIAASMTGPTTAPPPTLPANVVLITLAVAQLNILKETLK